MGKIKDIVLSAFSDFYDGYLAAIQSELNCPDWQLDQITDSEGNIKPGFTELEWEAGYYWPLSVQFETETRAECYKWFMDNLTLIAATVEAHSSYSYNRAGIDYWLTRNGHGAGFWDRGLGEQGEQLTTACENTPRDLYLGDDGRIYCD